MDNVRTALFVSLLLLAFALFLPFAQSTFEMFAIRLNSQSFLPRRPFSLHPELYEDASARPSMSPESEREFRVARRRVFLFGALFSVTVLVAAVFFEITA